jgi:dihydropteroate synthase
MPPLVMGILNLTQDSFAVRVGSEVPTVLAAAEQMLADGADWLDLGGESTRPGAAPVDIETELARVIPALTAIRARFPNARLSVDTSKPAVMRAALAAGADLINDVNALQAPGAIEAVASSTAELCLMHRQGTSQSMQLAPSYHNVVEEVLAFLAQRIQACEQAGIARQRIIVDPGFGFGKTLEHNCALFLALPQFKTLGCRLLVGLSRKSMLGAITGSPVEARMLESVVAAVLAAEHADFLRVHDVAETVRGLKMHIALRG